MSAPTGATTARWFVAAHTLVWEREDGWMTARPGSVRHAKQMGSLATACGTPTQSWPKFYEIPFAAVEPETACPSCCAVVRAEERVRSREWRPPGGA